MILLSTTCTHLQKTFLEPLRAEPSYSSAVLFLNNQWPLAGGTPTTLYSIWTYDNDRNLKYLTRVNSNPYDLLLIFGPMMMIVT